MATKKAEEQSAPAGEKAASGLSAQETAFVVKAIGKLDDLLESGEPEKIILAVGAYVNLSHALSVRGR